MRGAQTGFPWKVCRLRTIYHFSISLPATSTAAAAAGAATCDVSTLGDVYNDDRSTDPRNEQRRLEKEG